MKRIFAVVMILAALLFVEGLWAQDQKADPTGAGLAPDHVTLTWTADPRTTQTITWRAAAAVTKGVVEYNKGAALTKAALTGNAARTELVTDLGTVSLFTATLTGLQAGTTYSYRVGDGKTWSSALSFSTEAKTVGTLKFLIFGDSQSGIPDKPEYQPWYVTLQNAFSANPDARFIVNVGDLVETGQSYAHWNAWFNAARGVIDAVPEMAVQGNHETYADGIVGSIKPVAWAAQFPLPQNGPDTLANQVYSYDYGNVHFVVLDSQQDEEAPTYGDILQAQAKWLDNDLAKTTQPWKIVFFHKTPYYNKASRANEAIKAAFVPVLDKYHVDLVFNGHDHGVARTYALYNDEFVSKPSQGTIYVVTGRSGNKAYPDLSQKVWDAFFFDPQDQPNYMVAEVAGSTLALKTVKQDGTLVDTFRIDKAKDTDTDVTQAPIPSKTWTRYAAPTLVVFGNVVSPTMYGHGPMLKDGTWFVDANAFAGYIGAAFVAKDQGTVINMGGKDYPIAADKLVTDNKIVLLSVDALKALGFSAAFHKNTNLLELAK